MITFQPERGIEAEVEALQGQGVEFTGGVSSYDWGSVAPFRDSEGNDLQLYAPPSGRAEPGGAEPGGPLLRPAQRRPPVRRCGRPADEADGEGAAAGARHQADRTARAPVGRTPP